MVSFELRFTIKEQFYKKLVERMPLLQLACSIYKHKSLEAGQLLKVSLPNFIITKYLKQEVDDDLSVCVDECSPFGLSVTGDAKIYQCHMIKR